MSVPTVEDIFSAIVHIIEELYDDWEYSGEITHETTLLSDLGFQSIDAVALGSAVEDHFNQRIPFAQYLSDLEDKGIPDIALGDFVLFIQNSSYLGFKFLSFIRKGRDSNPRMKNIIIRIAT